MKIKKDLRKTHSLYKEYISLLNDDMDFYNAWEDTDEDFYEWVMSYEIDNDWKKEGV